MYPAPKELPKDVSELPVPLVDRLRHYFMTYKLVPGIESRVSIGEVYGREHAEKVIQASIDDYEESYGAG